MKTVHLSAWFKHVAVNETLNVAIRGTAMAQREFRSRN